MYLSRLVINPRSSDARRDLGDVQRMHRTIMSAFPQMKESGEARAELAVLYRLEDSERMGRTALLVQSRVLPDWTCLPSGYLTDSDEEVGNPATKPITKALEALSEGQILRFRLRANPTKKIDTKSGPDKRRRNGRRVELRAEIQQIEWLARKAEQSGFRMVPARPGSDVPAVRIGAGEKLRGKRRAGNLTIGGVLFEGLLEITHVDRFRRALREGIGPGKAFGCGLMSIAPYKVYA